VAREARRIDDDLGESTGPEHTAVERYAEGPPPLPDPAETAQALALCVAEILTGARDVESIARWITDDVQRHLHQRAAYAARARSASPHRTRRPSIRVGNVVVSRPRDGVAEASVVVHTRSRARAVAIRLEERAGRWRATAIGML
jgi:hypothetical protein